MSPAAKFTQPRTVKSMRDEDWTALAFEAQALFSPSAPLDEADLFAGRSEQLALMLEATTERGKHAILFGEPGVGKTSMARLFSKLFPPTARHIYSIREQADPSDDFDSLWRKVFKDIWVTVSREDVSDVRNLSELYPSKITPDDVRRELEGYFRPTEIPIIIIDEFDKIKDAETRSLVANTVKHLSDFSVNVTILLVAVADDVNALVGAHASLPRCLEQIPMPRMSTDERKEILEKIIPRLGMKLNPDALWKIVHLSRGLPSYVHALGQSAALAAIARRSLEISEADVDAAIKRVLKKSEESVQENYSKAVDSNRNDSMYKEVLLACALADTNDRGTFSPTSVCGPLTTILKRDKLVQIAAFQQHLQKFISSERGEVLVRKGLERSYRYRFKDPMMQPYVIMKGIEQGLVGASALEALSFPAQPRLPSI